jgi:hypothetical protein
MFDADWSPRPLRLTRVSLREKKSDERLLALSRSHCPVFDRLGVHYVPPALFATENLLFVLKIFFLVHLISIVIFAIT